MTGLVLVFGMYYAPYVYMFTASALRNMDPSLEEAAEIAGVGPLRTLFTVTFPLIAPAIISGMLLSFIVMLGIYGIPAVLGTPANIPVLTTYIFQLTNWSPPLYSTAAAVAIILMVVTGVLVVCSGACSRGAALSPWAGKASGRERSISGPGAGSPSLALAYIFIVVVLPTLALIVAGLPASSCSFRMPPACLIRGITLSFISTISSTIRSPCGRSGTRWRSASSLRVAGGALAFAIGYTVHRGNAPAGAAST